MGDPWGIGGFRGGGPKREHILKNNPPKNIKNRQNWKKVEKSEKKIQSIFTWNGVFSLGTTSQMGSFPFDGLWKKKKITKNIFF